MTKTTMIKMIGTGKFYEFVGELFGRTYYKDGEEVKAVHNREVMFYTEKEYENALKVMNAR